MNKRAVFHLVAYMTLVIGIAILGCAGISWFYDDPVDVRMSLVWSGAITILFAAVVGVLTRGDINLSRRDGFGVVTFGWLSATLFGSLNQLRANYHAHKSNNGCQYILEHIHPKQDVFAHRLSLPFQGMRCTSSKLLGLEMASAKRQFLTATYAALLAR